MTKQELNNTENEIEVVTTKEQADFLYENWAMTWEGLRKEDFGIALKECGGKNAKGYLISGKTMNELYNLKGRNAYRDDLNIFAVFPFRGLAMQFGARWFTDIVDNNARHN